MLLARFKERLVVVHKILSNEQNRRAEVDKESGFIVTRPKVAQQLGSMVVHDRLNGLQIHNQAILNKQVCEEVAQQGSVLVIDIERMLLCDFDALLAKPVCECVFVDSLKMPVPMVAVYRGACLPNDIAKRVYVIESQG